MVQRIELHTSGKVNGRGIDLSNRSLDRVHTRLRDAVLAPVFLGVSRPWHASILYGVARGFGEAMIGALSTDPSILVGANVPYVVSRDEDYTVPVHGDDRGVPTILVEIRHDLIRAQRGISEWADRLAAALRNATS